jgi:hypothetical protein
MPGRELLLRLMVVVVVAVVVMIMMTMTRSRRDEWGTENIPRVVTRCALLKATTTCACKVTRHMCLFVPPNVAHQKPDESGCYRRSDEVRERAHD